MPKTVPVYQTFIPRHKHHYIAVPKGYCEINDTIDILHYKDKNLLAKLTVTDYLYRPHIDTLPPPNSFCLAWFGCNWDLLQKIVQSRYVGCKEVSVVVAEIQIPESNE